MLVILGLVLIFAAYYFFQVFVDARKNNLSWNMSVGLKTPSVMASEKTWDYIHKKYAFIFLVGGFIVVIMLGIVILGGISMRSVNNMPMAFWIVLSIFSIALILWLIIMGIIANHDAFQFDIQEGIL